VAVRWPQKYIRFVSKTGIFILKIGRDITLLIEGRYVSILRVCKAACILVGKGIY